MKYYQLIIITLLSAIAAHAQINTFTVGLNLGNQPSENFFEQTSDGGYIVISSRIDTGQNFQADKWAYIAKLNSVGDTQWVKCILKSTASQKGGDGYSICEASDGGYLIATDYFHLDTNSSQVRKMVYAIKLDASGNLMWSRLYRGEGTSSSGCVRITANHDFVICGSTADSVANHNGGFVLRIDSVGNIVWTKKYTEIPYTAGQDFRSIRETQNGDFIMCGNRNMFRLDASGNVLWSKTPSLGITNYDAVEMPGGDIVCIGHHGTTYCRVFRYTANGTMLWAKEYQSGPALFGESLVPTWDGFTFAAAGRSIPSTGARLVHVDHNGNVLWAREYPFANGGTIYYPDIDLERTADGGYAFSTYGQDSGYFLGVQRLIVKVDSMGGNPCWSNPVSVQVSVPSTSGQVNYYTYSVDLISSTPTTVMPFVTPMNILCLESGTEYISSTDFHLFPNPADNELTVTLPHADGKTYCIEVYNSIGQLVLESKTVFSAQTQSANLDITSLTLGLYFLEISENGAPVAKRKFIKE